MNTTSHARHSTEPRSRAVVLGAGAVVGTAWTLGLAAGLRRHGVELTDGDLIVGTSAGAIVGTILTTGQNLEAIATRQTNVEWETTPISTTRRLDEVFTILADTSLDAIAARRRIGQLAVFDGLEPEESHLARIEALITPCDWSHHNLLITAVDADTGDLTAWNRTSGVPLLQAVAASTAMPGLYPPITINGHRYLDAGIRSATNADLAVGACQLIVVDPVAHLFPRDHLTNELAMVHANTVIDITPDHAAMDAYGHDPLDQRAWPSCYGAGLRQSVDAAAKIRDTWGGHTNQRK